MTITPKPEQDKKTVDTAKQDSKTLFLQQAGAFSDDSSLSELRNNIYQARGRSETDDDVSS
ncbi:hypothetical protein [Crocosphaera sp.]|uniref:hypothetical protein n=1 Tax=Crocosphaera sp. TaxID=2729996 RepID=UPI003F28CD15